MSPVPWGSFLGAVHQRPELVVSAAWITIQSVTCERKWNGSKGHSLLEDTGTLHLSLPDFHGGMHLHHHVFPSLCTVSLTVMASLGHQLDNIWNQLKPQQQGNVCGGIFLIVSFEVGRCLVAASHKKGLGRGLLLLSAFLSSSSLASSCSC